MILLSGRKPTFSIKINGEPIIQGKLFSLMRNGRTPVRWKNTFLTGIWRKIHVPTEVGMSCALTLPIKHKPTKQDTMKAKSIVAIEVSMALTGIAMIGLMVVASFM